MIEKKVIIFVRGEQSYDDMPPDKTELVSEGTMTIADDGRVTLEYPESELTGMEGTVTRFDILGDTATLTRTGTICSQMVFQPGKTHSSLYQTQWGALTMDIHTASLVHRLDAHGGILQIKYTISVEHQVTGRSQCKIKVRDITR